MKTAVPLSLAAAVMALASASFAAEAPKGSKGGAVGANDKVHCYNVHACKGNSDCATAEHSCKGQNGCKGHGFKAVSAKSCLDQGGVIADIKS